MSETFRFEVRPTLDHLRRRVENGITRLQRFDPEGADRFGAALEAFWTDEVTLYELIRDVNSAVAEEVRLHRGR